MDNTIGADAAKLAGLLADLLHKLRSGHITPGHLERFNNLSAANREALFRHREKPEPTAAAEPSARFTLHGDLGTLTVPDDYVHATALAAFRSRKYSSSNWNADITDAHFRNPSTVLRPGDRLRVRVFVGNVETSVDERMAFLKEQNAVHTGAQGAALVGEQLEDKLDTSRSYYSLDFAPNLWHAVSHGRQVPFLSFSSGLRRRWVFDLDLYLRVWRNAPYSFLCFNLMERVGSFHSPRTGSDSAAAAIPAFAET